MKKKAAIPYENVPNEMLQDRELAAMYLDEALAAGDHDLFKTALRDVARARFGGMKALSERTGLKPAHLYHMFSKKGNLRLETARKVLDALGLRFTAKWIRA